MTYELIDETPKYELLNEPTSAASTGSTGGLKNLYMDAMKRGAMAIGKGLVTGGPLGAALAGAGEGLKNLPIVADYAGGAATDYLAGKVPPEVAAGIGTALNVGIQSAPTFLSPGKAVLSAEDLARNALIAQRASILQKGRELGYKVPPMQVNPSITNLILESAGGKAPTAQRAAALNEDVTYKIAQREAGLQPSESINLDTLKTARERLSQPYRDIASLESVGPLSQPPFKSPAVTLEELKGSRNNAKELWAYYGRSQNPEILTQAKAASARSDQLEEALAVQAADAGKPELAQALREARVALAKNYTVQRAMRGSSFDPSALSRLESRGKTPLSGDLETIMQMYRDFPKAMAAPQVGGSVGVHQLMPQFGAGGGAILGGILGGLSGASVGAPLGVATTQLVPPLMRKLLLSDPYQSLMVNYAPKTTSGLTPSAITRGSYGALLTSGLLPQPALLPQLGILAQP